MCIFLCGKEGGGAHKRKNTRQTTDEKIESIFHLRFFNSWLSFTDVTSFFYYYYENKNASATHLHDLLGIPDDFEEKRASGGEQRDEAVSF